MKNIFGKIILFAVIFMSLAVQDPSAQAQSIGLTQINLAPIPIGDSITVLTKPFYSILDHATYGSDQHGFSTSMDATRRSSS